MEADATDIRSLQCTARRLPVCACPTSDSAFPNIVVQFRSNGRLSSTSVTACALLLLLLLLYHVCFMKRSSYCAAHHSLQSEQLKIFVFKMYFSAVVNFSCGCLFCITGKEQSVETRFRPPALMCALRPCNS